MDLTVCLLEQVELPRVSPAYKGKPYRYMYSVSAKPPCTAANALAKYDVDQGSCKTWFEPGALPTGETGLEAVDML